MIDLEELARAKGLPAETLRSFGLTDQPTGGVRIDYRAPSGGSLRARLRVAIGGPDGSRWEDSESPMGAYWQPLSDRLVDERGLLLLCEGESSCWTAWQSGFGAVGIPGADRVDLLRDEHLALAETVVAVLEPEDPQTYPHGRATYLAEVTGRLRALRYEGRVFVIDLDGIAADLNALFCADPRAFAGRLLELIEKAPALGSGGDSSDDLRSAVSRTRRLLGCAAPDVPVGIETAGWLEIGRFAEATGDESPLYHDVQYGACSIHGTLLAPPAFVLAARMPDSAGALDVAPHRLVDTLTALQILWDDNVRLADRLSGRVWLTDAEVTTDETGRPCARIRSSATWERNGLGLAQGHCEVSLYQIDGSPFSRRSIQRYKQQEISAIKARLDAEPARRGDLPRYWSSTAPGDLMMALTKGPLTFSDLLVWKVAEGRPMKAGNIHHRELASQPGRRATNPLTNWPVWDRTEAWDDSAASHTAGLPAPAASGGLLFALASQTVTHWMGDDAFLRRMAVRIRQPLFYGDTLDLGGHVAHCFTATDEAGHHYYAVSVEVHACNQLGEPVLSGEAVVLLPEPGRPVRLPLSGALARNMLGYT